MSGKPPKTRWAAAGELCPVCAPKVPSSSAEPGSRRQWPAFRAPGCENACNHDPTPNDAYRTDNAMKSRSERGHFSHPTLTPLNSKFTSKINQMVDSGVGSRLDAILHSNGLRCCAAGMV